MYKKINFLISILSAVVIFASAQPQIGNGGFERWRGDEFGPDYEKCCGPLLALPAYWGTVEQLMQLANNQLVFKETDSVNVHSGNFSARLFTDTTTVDSAGNVAAGISVLVPGVVACSGIVAYGSISMAGNPYLTPAYSVGYPFTGNPLFLNFYMKMSHAVPDTAFYAYTLTRWDSVAMKEDTLAFNARDIPDALVAVNQWQHFIDTISYLQNGAPDTLRLIFYGGRNGDISKYGNITWLDDVSFSYNIEDTLSGIGKLTAESAVEAYPNPASDILNLKADETMIGANFTVYDATGRTMTQMMVSLSFTAIELRYFSSGIYFYRLLDKEQNEMRSGKFIVEK